MSLVCPFTGKDVLERHVSALELLRITFASSRITTVIMVFLEGRDVILIIGGS